MSPSLDFCSEPEASALECVSLAVVNKDVNDSTLRRHKSSWLQVTSSRSSMREVALW